MSDLRLCVVCNALVDLDGKDLKVIARPGASGKRTMVLDSEGRVHALQTKRLTTAHLEKGRREETKDVND